MLICSLYHSLCSLRSDDTMIHRAYTTLWPGQASHHPQSPELTDVSVLFWSSHSTDVQREIITRVSYVTCIFFVRYEQCDDILADNSLIMLKHCSTSCVDVSRRSLRHSSLTLDTDTRVIHTNTRVVPPLYTCVSLYSIPGHVSTNSSVDSSETSSETEDRDSCHNDSVSTHVSGHTIRVYATCLRPHLAYKTIMIQPHTTSRHVISSLLTRFRMRHRDHKLYYLTMEVTVNNSLQTITLEDNSRPAELISCNPWGGCKFILRSKSGGRVKIYDDQIRPDSVYKSIIISRETTVADTLAILLNCYPQLNTTDQHNICLYEADTSTGQERLLDGEQCPLQISEEWNQGSGQGNNSSNTKENTKEAITNRRFVVKFRTEDVNVPHFNSDENGFIIVKRNSFLRQSVRKKNFLRSMICISGGLKTVDINIDSDSLGDTETESDTSELNTSEEEFNNPEAKLDPMEYSEEDESLLDSSVILDSFYT